MRMAMGRWTTKYSFGNRPATRGRRLILRLIGLYILEVCKRRRDFSGSLKMVSPLRLSQPGVRSRRSDPDAGDAGEARRADPR